MTYNAVLPEDLWCTKQTT